ncbi:4-(cytidine 5'-diphospho)-2-C-methyl-D-erythritol kinase [Corynebacterium aquilae]|uniref:4-(cytidine 5'-diphospho)-2-C-methyl-D-erythritol kinase n=1 Tax=Corynebacterium aquilae TaxID=203263 RepID=UPI0009518EAF|nr:4-(cytidine 5'-diphospho)-2-C-methyl-D-erythritol kinase [Corynebacterium aquilae]
MTAEHHATVRPTPNDQARKHPHPFNMNQRIRPGATTYEETARAKVNLHLAVGDARADGYHELDTVFQSLSLADTIAITPCDHYPADGESVVKNLNVTGPLSHVIPTDHTNLAWGAAEAFAAAARKKGTIVARVSIRITKGIPVAGGMAGGSADAAGVLRLLNRIYSYPLSSEELLEIGLGLGSDVPFCILEGTARAGGRGEKLTQFTLAHTLHFALAFHRRGLSTPKVFGTLDRMRDNQELTTRAGDPRALIAALENPQASIDDIAQLIDNDLQAPALSMNSALSHCLEVGRAAGAAAAFISGSGPTCAFLCHSAEHARAVAETITDAGAADDTACAHTTPAAAI